MSSYDARPAEVVPGASRAQGTAGGALAAEGAADGAAGTGGAAGGGSAEWRRLSFRTSGLTVELEITGAGDYRRLAGQLIPRQPAFVQIRHADGVITVEANALGRFSAESVPPGPISLRCRLGPVTDYSPVSTGWITI